MHASDDIAEENRRLRRTMRDLVALSTLPAVWTGSASNGIARSLADVLLGTLSLDLVYVRLTGRTDEGEVVRSSRRPAADLDTVRAAVAPLLSQDSAAPPSAVADPFGGGTLQFVVTRFGIGDDHGVLVTGSSNAEYPTERDRLLLGVAANQAAVVVQRRRTEEQLRASETQFRTLFESMDEGYCVIEFLDGPHGPLSDYVHVIANPAYATNAGIPDIVGQKVREMVPDEADAWVETYRNVLLTGEPVRFERELVATGRHLELAAFRIEPPERRQVAVLFRDVTARRQAEEQVRESEERLLDADRRKDEFLATLAHELRNPLAPIRNAVQIMQMSGEPGARDEALTMIERQLGQMVRLVDDLMDVSRITRNQLELKRERVDLATVVQNAVETSRPLIDQMGHHLTVKLPQQPVYLEADTTRLAQAFLNLLNNSAKYTEPQGRIWLTAEQVGNEVAVSVRDDGIGIPVDKLSGVFDLFSQVEGALSRSRGGLGIGLSLVKRLVEMHGGSVTAKSDGLGRGSTFTVRLPVLVEGSRLQPSGERREESVPTSALRVLIVDDNRDGANILGKMLRLMGNDTRTAYDGEEAVTAAGEYRPHVVLLDIGLPKLNGYEACRRIREQPWGKGMEVIALTGWGQDEDVQRSHDAGFNHHLVKPVDPKALMKLLAGLQLRQKHGD